LIDQWKIYYADDISVIQLKAGGLARCAFRTLAVGEEIPDDEKEEEEDDDDQHEEDEDEDA
jgi:hypothetical protein